MAGTASYYMFVRSLAQWGPKFGWDSPILYVYSHKLLLLAAVKGSNFALICFSKGCKCPMLAGPEFVGKLCFVLALLWRTASLLCASPRSPLPKGSRVNRRRTVVVGWPEGVVSHPPSRWEDDEVRKSHSRTGGFGRQDSENGRVLHKKRQTDRSENMAKFRPVSPTD